MDLILKLKKAVAEASENPSFIHHKWYIKYHIEIVEKIALELCDVYQEADSELVLVIVWLHDYPKIIQVKDKIESSLKIRELMKEIGFKEEFIQKVLSSYEIFENPFEIDLNTAPIEVKITSSADAAAHLVGPFYMLYWYENPQKSIEELLKDNAWKSNHDWTKKIVLPEIKNSFEKRFHLLNEMIGNFPEKYLE
ncbi:MAG: hypothetical protein ACMG6E_02650 [Candidatus Roizmanbacteria bacterium]